jgi:hypothetical protein
MENVGTGFPQFGHFTEIRSSYFSALGSPFFFSCMVSFSLFVVFENVLAVNIRIERRCQAKNTQDLIKDR